MHNRSSLDQVDTESFNGWSKVITGFQFSLALNTNTLYAWGTNEYSQLSTIDTISNPTLVGNNYV